MSKPRDANSSAVDGAALLRRVAIYIEEDPRAADKLGAVVSELDRGRMGIAEAIIAALTPAVYKYMYSIQRVSGYKELVVKSTIYENIYSLFYLSTKRKGLLLLFCLCSYSSIFSIVSFLSNKSNSRNVSG